MATRWGKMKKDLKELVNHDKITPTDVEVIEKFILHAEKFDCGKCEFMTDRQFLCDNSIDCCRQAHANWLNQEVTETKNIKK